jgi:hypothetical protein
MHTMWSNRIPPAGARTCASALVLVCGIVGAQAQAQVAESILIQPDYPDIITQYRQSAANEQGDGDWQAQGTRVGSFNLYPRVRVGASATNNAYLSSIRKVAAPFVTIAPSVQAYSNWSRHSLAVTADGNFARYIGQPRRNETSWAARAEGGLDVTSALSLTAAADSTQLALNRFSGDLTIDAASVAIIRQNSVAVSGQYRAGRSRLLASLENFDLTYRRILLSDGSLSDQSARNHAVTRLSGQAEYSPAGTVTLFAQMAYIRFDYGNVPTPSVSTSDSNGIRALAGLRWEVQGLGRLTLAGSYSHRTYAVNDRLRVNRPGAEARVEIFASPLTTIRLEAADRTIDARLIDVTPIRQRSANVSVFHALYRNVTLGLNAAVIRQKNLFSIQSSRIGNIGLNGRILMSRNWEFGAQLNYSTRHSQNIVSNYTLQELAGGISATLKL